MTNTRTVFKALAVRACSDSTRIHQHRRSKLRCQDAALKLTSCAAIGAAGVEYAVGEWATAPDWLAQHGHHLVAFIDLASAVDFVRKHGFEQWVAIFEAEAVPTKTMMPRRCSLNKLAQHILSGLLDSWPSGTVMAQRIKPIRCVWATFDYAPLGIMKTEE